MRQTTKYEFWVGLFLLLGIGALVFLGLKVANVQSFSSAKTYQIYATFDNIGGLKVRAPLKIGGVVIGRVTDISLDPKSYTPRVTLAVDQSYNQIPETSSLSIKTSGLLGEQYISLSLGFADEEFGYLKDGDQLVDTKSAMVLEDLVGQFLYVAKNKDEGKADEDNNAAEPSAQSAQ